MTERTPCIVLGATGYVGGELLRLVAGHPGLELHAATSDRQAGTAIADQFPHLASHIDSNFVSTDDAMATLAARQSAAVFSAAPHGAAAATIAATLDAAEAAGTSVHIVDASADFRYADADAYAAVYGHAHGAPERLPQFVSAVPEHLNETPAKHVGHPGCFATAMQLAIVPLLKHGRSKPEFVATGITGATGSGKMPTATTHLPERHANLFAYKPLSHRHAPEVVAHVAAATGTTPALHFVPHSGPFARGIHMTVVAPATAACNEAALREAFAGYYASAPFIRVVDGMPRLKSVVGSNFAHIGVATANDTVCVTVVIDNLVKGAAGGAVQWMNRLLGLDETAGLMQSAAGWT
ncbi:MAG: N-acetyl-gamma-glutamyl-phosphate reductase [Pseudomonadota bacterium]